MIIMHNYGSGFTAFYEINGLKFSILDHGGVHILYYWSSARELEFARNKYDTSAKQMEDFK